MIDAFFAPCSKGPRPPNEGIATIRKELEAFYAITQQLEVIVHQLTENDRGVVMIERTDRFLMKAGHWAQGRVASVFEIEGGKIKAWRDYFDNAQFNTAMEGAGAEHQAAVLLQRQHELSLHAPTTSPLRIASERRPTSEPLTSERTTQDSAARPS